MHSLTTAALELKHQQSSHLVELIAKDESVRKLRFEVQVLQDDNVELRGLLGTEQERSNRLETLMDDYLVRAETAEVAAQSIEHELRGREQEIAALAMESKALKNLSTDTSKIVTEKLELTHELSRLRPEVEHLRAQVSANEALLAEKLALQRKLGEFEIEVDQAKRDAQRAIAKRRNTMHEVAQEDELEALRKSLSKEKRCHERAKETIEELQTERDALKKADQNDMVAETQQMEQSAQTDVRTEELKRDVARQQKEKVKAEKALQSAHAEWISTKAVLDDKLTQYKNRVRTLRDRLKEAETALEQARTVPSQLTTGPIPTKAANVKPGRKRGAQQMDADATTLGTPGDGPAKRSRKNVPVGEKSSFSITPFLNRTMSAAPDTPGADVAISEAETTPTISKAAKPASRKKEPLAAVPASEQNIKKPVVTTKAKIALQVVEEDPDEDVLSPSRPDASTTTSTTTTTMMPVPSADMAKANASKATVRKSLATFAAFNFEPEPEKKRSRARKLGGLGKTLFDEEDDATTSKVMPGRGALGGVGKMGPLGALARGSFLGGPKSKTSGAIGAALRTEDGFMFSPLKRDRKASGISFLK